MSFVVARDLCRYADEDVGGLVFDRASDFDVNSTMTVVSDLTSPCR